MSLGGALVSLAGALEGSLVIPRDMRSENSFFDQNVTFGLFLIDFECVSNESG